jgi:hypothetical protein
MKKETAKWVYINCYQWIKRRAQHIILIIFNQQIDI